jgi:hypothetical protein
MCEHVLNTVETGLLCDNEYFRCPLCHTDLAALAYQQEAYHEQRWLPVILALGDLCIEKKCRDCCYLAAIAKSCWSAFSWMPSAESKSIQSLARLFQTSPQIIPDCDWQSCLAVKQYQKLAGDGLRIL